jgi:hypothetical protein
MMNVPPEASDQELVDLAKRYCIASAPRGAVPRARARRARGVGATFMPNLDAGENPVLKRSAEILKEAAEGVRL